MNQPQHIQQVIDNFSSEQIAINRLRVNTSIEASRWLVSRAISFRGHDESRDSLFRRNFLDIVALMGRLDKKIGDVLDNAPEMSLTHHQRSKKKFYMFLQLK